jgi:hypothetical protein
MEMAAPYEPKKNSEIRIFESSDDMATDLAEYISQVSEISVKERGYFTVARISQDEHVSAALRCCSVDVCWHSLQTRHSFSSMLISASLTLTEL